MSTFPSLLVQKKSCMLHTVRIASSGIFFSFVASAIAVGSGKGPEKFRERQIDRQTDR